MRPSPTTTMDWVTHHGRTTAYRQSDRGGDGAGLLCVHGAGGARGVWKAQYRMADRRPVAALDLSGHGDSEDVDADPGFGTRAAYASDVQAVADETGAGVLAGTSLGGAVCLHLLLEREFDAAALVLAGTGPRLPVLEDLQQWLADDFERAVEFLHEPGRLFHDPDDDLVELSTAAMYDCGQAVVHRDFLTSDRFDVRDRLEEIDVPTLAVVGEHDRLTPRWYHEDLAEGIPDCELAVIEDAGHLAMLERPAAFNAAVSSFLDRV